MSKSADALARREVLHPDARRPVLRRPARPGLPRRAGQHVVRLEPLRPLPAGAREELGAEVPVARVERRELQLARMRHLLERVEDVVDLAVLLGAARADVRRRRHERVEAVRVRLGHVHRGLARRRSTRRPSSPCPPAWVTQTASQIQKPRTSADSPTIEPMSGVNENMPLIAVDSSTHVLHRREQAALSSCDLEVRGRERLDARLRLTVPIRAEILRLEQDRLVPVVAERVPIALAAGSTATGPGGAGSGGPPPDPRPRRAPATASVQTSWCCTTASGIGTPAIRPIVGPQIPAQTRTCSHSTSPCSVRTPCTRPSRMSNPVTRTPPSNVTPFASRLRGERRRHSGPLRDPVRRHEVGAEDVAGIEDRDPLGGLLGGEQLRSFDPVRAGVAAAPLQLLDPLVRRRDLDAADAVPGGLAVGLEPRVQVDRVLREPAHRPRAVRLEHEPGRVRGRASGLEQRPLIDHEDVGHTELGQVVRGARRRRSRRRSRRAALDPS